MSETLNQEENVISNENNNRNTIKTSTRNINELNNNLSEEDVNKLVNTFYKMNYLIKNKKIEYVNENKINEAVEEKVIKDSDEDNLMEIIKEIDKQPIPYNETYFIDRDPIYYKSEKKGNKQKINKTALLQDLTVKTSNNAYNKEEEYSVFDQLQDLDEVYKRNYIK